MCMCSTHTKQTWSLLPIHTLFLIPIEVWDGTCLGTFRTSLLLHPSAFPHILVCSGLQTACTFQFRLPCSHFHCKWRYWRVFYWVLIKRSVPPAPPIPMWIICGFLPKKILWHCLGCTVLLWPPHWWVCCLSPRINEHDIKWGIC